MARPVPCWAKSSAAAAGLDEGPVGAAGGSREDMEEPIEPPELLKALPVLLQ